MVTAANVILCLHEMFYEQGRQPRTEVIEAKIDHQTQMDMIVNALPDSFAQFKINYELNKKEYNLTGLMNDLQVAKKILLKEKHDESNIVEAAFLGYAPKSFKKVKRKRQKGKKENLAPWKKNTKKEAKPKGKCFHCGVLGHWKRNCQVYLAQKKSDKGVPRDQKLE
ncbi:hypothetical protein Patl1_08109 [Pistacia atlantica]|uniref:Uncharacterized protein n=1 Tax=Pistacia atlantica TaxID=434234 RepID=A0ACC1AFC7_9ROSI|nr:hypothetical protein Patl1_08109 [Pistacia atlantica]